MILIISHCFVFLLSLSLSLFIFLTLYLSFWPALFWSIMSSVIAVSPCAPRTRPPSAPWQVNEYWRDQHATVKHVTHTELVDAAHSHLQLSAYCFGNSLPHLVWGISDCTHFINPRIHLKGIPWHFFRLISSRCHQKQWFETKDYIMQICTIVLQMSKDMRKY